MSCRLLNFSIIFVPGQLYFHFVVHRGSQRQHLSAVKSRKLCGAALAQKGELCGIVRKTGNCAISHSPHLNVASDTEAMKRRMLAHESA